MITTMKSRSTVAETCSEELNPMTDAEFDEWLKEQPVPLFFVYDTESKAIIDDTFYVSPHTAKENAVDEQGVYYMHLSKAWVYLKEPSWNFKLITNNNDDLDGNEFVPVFYIANGEQRSLCFQHFKDVLEDNPDLKIEMVDLKTLLKSMTVEKKTLSFELWTHDEYTELAKGPNPITL